jgi:hypothetical protein
MKKVTYDLLFTLLDDEEINIQEQALLIFRALLFKTPEDVEEVFSNCKVKLLKKIEEKLLTSTNTDIVVQAFYLLCNISSGNEKQKQVILDFIPRLCDYLDHSDSRVKNVCVLILLNICNLSELDKKVQNMSTFISKIESIANDEENDPDTRENAKVVLIQLRKTLK